MFAAHSHIASRRRPPPTARPLASEPSCSHRPQAPRPRGSGGDGPHCARGAARARLPADALRAGLICGPSLAYRKIDRSRPGDLC